jgi:hypothetical protein
LTSICQASIAVAYKHLPSLHAEHALLTCLLCVSVHLQVDVFLMPPAGSGAGEAKRRSTLLSRRTEWRALGIPEELYPPSMTDEELM